MIRPLGDLPPTELLDALHQVAEWAANYRSTVQSLPIVPGVEPGDVAAMLPASMPEEGESMQGMLAELDAVVMPGVMHWGHPAFFGYYGSTSNGPALIGEIVAAALNTSAMTWKTSPAATELETVVSEWIRDLLGFPSHLFGIVYDTASVALLHALAAARSGATTDTRVRGVANRPDVPTLRVYASDQAHSSLVKAMVMLGLGEDNIVRIATDGDFRMDVELLEEAMTRDHANGLKPMAVVATIGTTSTASVDPVAEIARVAQAFGAWLHVDAAYGGALAALPEERWVTKGLEHADSVVVNPHKWLFVPLDYSVLYVRAPEIMRALFSETPEYLEGDAQAVGHATSRHAIDYMDYGIQLGRRFRALKAWMVFRAFGRRGIVERIREHRRLAKLFQGWVDAAPNFELAAPVPMAVVCFRYRPNGASRAECDAANAAIVASINASGQAYLTHTRVGGQTCMRIGIGNIATTEAHLAELWQAIREKIT